MTVNSNSFESVRAKIADAFRVSLTEKRAVSMTEDIIKILKNTSIKMELLEESYLFLNSVLLLNFDYREFVLSLGYRIENNGADSID